MCDDASKLPPCSPEAAGSMMAVMEKSSISGKTITTNAGNHGLISSRYGSNEEKCR